MKNLIFITFLTAIFCLPDLSAQKNWEIRVLHQFRGVNMEMANHPTVNVKYYGINTGQTPNIWNIGAKRRLAEQFWLGIEFAKFKLDYDLRLDRDFGDLDLFLNFSEPTQDGDDENLHYIRYDNQYTRWAVNLDYQVFELKNKQFSLFVGLGGEWLRLEDWTYTDAYRDKENHNILSSEGNNLATPSQKQEALEFFNNRLADQVSFINLRFGAAYQPTKNISISSEPLVSFPLNSFHKEVTDAKTGFAMALALGVRF